jgi:hypothetical protein
MEDVVRRERVLIEPVVISESESQFRADTAPRSRQHLSELIGPGEIGESCHSQRLSPDWELRVKKIALKVRIGILISNEPAVTFPCEPVVWKYEEPYSVWKKRIRPIPLHRDTWHQGRVDLGEQSAFAARNRPSCDERGERHEPLLSAANTPMTMYNSSFTRMKNDLVGVMALIAMGAELAAAGLIALPRTGQTNSYYAGDDGALRAGVPWPEPRFTNHGNGTATDWLTGLMWATDGNLVASRDPAFDQDGTAGDGVLTWFHALQYIEKLNAESGLGCNDWRMPNVIEMLSLVDHGRANPALPVGHPFTNVADWYFTATTRTDLPIIGWSINLQTGAIDYQGFKFETNPVVKCRFLVVRGGSAGAVQLPQSGQTRSFAPRDDGALRSGMPAPVPRFMAVGDGTVRDRLTGLIWPQSGPMASVGVTWSNAFSFVADMNSGARTNFGHSDWRLPNRPEALSLIDRGQASPAFSRDHPFASLNTFWCSTTSARDSNKVWYAEPTFGISSDGLPKSSTAPVWPVRSDTTPLGGHAIRGRVLQSGQPLAGAQIELSGPLAGSMETDTNGQFAFTFLPDGDYRLRVSKLYWSFTPPVRNIPLAGSDLTAPDFTGELAEEYGWVDLSANLPNSAGISVLSAMCFVGEQGWIASGWKGEIYHTRDGGRTFSVQNLPNRLYAVAMRDALEGYAGGESGRLYRTTNGGANWTLIGSLGRTVTAIAWAANGEAAFAGGENGASPSPLARLDGSTITRFPTWWVGTINSIQYPVDAREGWICAEEFIDFYKDGVEDQTIPQSHPTLGYGRMHMLDRQYGWAVASGLIGYNNELIDGGWVVHTEDGHNWDIQFIPSTKKNAAPSDVRFLNRSEGWVVGPKGLILHTTNSGDSWTYQAAGLTRNGLQNVWPIDARTVYASGENGTFLRYTRLSTQPAQPHLAIAASGTNVVLRWPATATNFTLTATPQLGAGAVWTAVSNPPSLLGTNQVVTNAAIGVNRFYRLTDQP